MNGGGHSALPARFALQRARPAQKAQQFPACRPEKSEHAGRPQRLRAPARIGFDAPADIGASPRHQPVAAGCVPEKSQRSQQKSGTLCAEYSAFLRAFALSRFLAANYCSLLNRLFDSDSICAITSSSAVCCVSSSDNCVETAGRSACMRSVCAAVNCVFSLVVALDAALSCVIELSIVTRCCET